MDTSPDTMSAHDHKVAAAALRELIPQLAEYASELHLHVSDPDNEDTWAELSIGEWITARADEHHLESLRKSAAAGKPKHHHVSLDRTQIICTAPAGAFCHQRPNCDSSTWDDFGCDEHQPPHEPEQTDTCWAADMINKEGIHDVPSSSEAPLVAGSPVAIYFSSKDSRYHLEPVPRQPHPPLIPELSNHYLVHEDTVDEQGDEHTTYRCGCGNTYPAPGGEKASSRAAIAWHDRHLIMLIQQAAQAVPAENPRRFYDATTVHVKPLLFSSCDTCGRTIGHDEQYTQTIYKDDLSDISYRECAHCAEFVALADIQGLDGGHSSDDVIFFEPRTEDEHRWHRLFLNQWRTPEQALALLPGAELKDPIA